MTTNLRSIELPPIRTSAAAARRFVTDALGADHALIDTAVLLVSELASNAVLHAGSTLVVSVEFTAKRIRIEVADADPRHPVPRHYDDDAVTGRGLHIVEACADRWGVTDRVGGKAVWFELVPPPEKVAG